jgi:tetratricopeptide (TPR) repeat protein
MDLGKDAEAVETLQKALAAGCSAKEIFDQLGAALTKLGDLEEAERVIQQGLAQYPQSGDTWLDLGQTQLQLGQFVEAEKSLHKALSLGTTDRSVYFSMATACARQGKQQEAAEYRKLFAEGKAAREAATEDRFQDRYDWELRRIAVAAICRSGTVFEHQTQLSRAEELFLRAYHLDPASLVVCGELSRFFREQGRVADAMLVQRRLVEIDAENPAHSVNLANLSMQLGDFAQAERALKQVIVNWPETSLGYLGLAQVYLQTGNHQQARFFAEAALRQRPENRDEVMGAYYLLAEACRRGGDQAAADAAAQEAARLSSP